MVKKCGIGLDYSEPKKNDKKHVVEESELVKKVNNPPETPHVLINAKKPLFKKFTPEPFDEESLYIHHELLVEDVERLKSEKAKKPSESVSTDESNAGLGFKSNTKKSKNKNGRIGGNGPRKLCNNCGSAGYLTHACKKVKVDDAKNVHVHNMSKMLASF